MKKGVSPGDKGGRCVVLTLFSALCTDYLKILGTSASWSADVFSRPVYGQLYIYTKFITNVAVLGLFLVWVTKTQRDAVSKEDH
jgi:hypothetical protein